MKVNLINLLIPFFLIAITGCAKNNLPDLPDVGIPIEQLNKDLRIIALPDFNTFKIGESIHLEIRMESDLEVEILPDLASQIFILTSETERWQIIQEVPDLGIFEHQAFILSRRNNGIREISIDLDPILPDKSKPVDLLIVVTGNVIREGKVSDQKVGAYIIIKLKP